MTPTHSKYTVSEAVLRIVGAHFGIPGSTLSLDDSIRGDLGADYYDQQELVMTVEELFDVRLTEDRVARIVTIRDIVAILEEMHPKTVWITL